MYFNIITRKNCSSLGIVTTTRITHASPSGAYAHTSCRDWESDADMLSDKADPLACQDIATQLIKNKPGNMFQVLKTEYIKLFPCIQLQQSSAIINVSTNKHDIFLANTRSKDKV